MRVRGDLRKPTAVRSLWGPGLIVVGGLAAAAPAFAQQAAPPTAAGTDFVEQPVGAPGAASAPPAAGRGPFDFLNNSWRSSAFFGDLWGGRPFLAHFGTTLTVTETSEALGNVSGGATQKSAYEGLTTATLQTDTQRAFGLYGGTFNVSALQIHGGNLSNGALDTLQTASGIEADRATRLWELWYQQKFNDQFDVKIGQQSLDQEFMVSQNALLFVNTMFGWPMLPSADLPGGGPAYPLSDLGIRARVHLTDNFTLLTGIFNGSPVAGNSGGDPQQLNPSGTSFPLGGGVLAIAELQFVYPGQNTIVKAGENDPLSRTYKIGAWWDSDSFSDLRYDTNGVSLASPVTNGNPTMHNGDYAFYAVADQMLYRFADDPDRNINAFIRPMFTPLQDRNLITFSINSGLTMHEPFFGRDDDTLGLAMGYTKVSNGASALDRATAYYSPGTFSPVRTDETFLEATYQYQATPWLQIQPDFQYVFNPGGGIANPNNLNQRIHDEAVFGIRLNANL
jgi:porin